MATRSSPADIVGGGGAIDSTVSQGTRIFQGRAHGYRHFNVDAVRPPTKADFGIGNAPKDPIRGPGINVFDVSMYKNIPLSSDEKRRLQFRFEFYNFFNHASFQGVDTGTRFDAAGKQVSATVGNYTSTLDARRIVLGVKLYF
ncbi:MAG: hypothetical protein LC114_26040 [Bryobacterales bacterium]|nr:hypothetical protein [Bryobacterales bacterium]